MQATSTFCCTRAARRSGGRPRGASTSTSSKTRTRSTSRTSWPQLASPPRAVPRPLPTPLDLHVHGCRRNGDRYGLTSRAAAVHVRCPGGLCVCAARVRRTPCARAVRMVRCTVSARCKAHAEHLLSTGRAQAEHMQSTIQSTRRAQAEHVLSSAGAAVNMVSVPRKAKEAIGAVCQLTHSDGRRMVHIAAYSTTSTHTAHALHMHVHRHRCAPPHSTSSSDHPAAQHVRGCNPTCQRLQPYVLQAASLTCCRLQT